MKEKNWKELGSELEELLDCMTEETSVDVVIKKDSIELIPSETNLGSAFHYMDTVVDFCRCKKLSSYVFYDAITRNVNCCIF